MRMQGQQRRAHVPSRCRGSHDSMAIDRLMARISAAHAPNPAWPPALFLDADRRGLGFTEFTASLLAALTSVCHHGGMNAEDLRETAEGSGISATAADPLLTAFASGNGLVEPDTGSGSDDPLCLLEVLSSFAREGYSLKWLAERMAARDGIAWPDVAAAADGIWRERRGGSTGQPDRAG